MFQPKQLKHSLLAILNLLSEICSYAKQLFLSLSLPVGLGEPSFASKISFWEICDHHSECGICRSHLWQYVWG